MSVKFISYTNKVLKQFEDALTEGLKDCIDPGVDAIKDETPVDTGNLKQSNDGELKTYDTVTFYNKADYASYVEFGTYKQYANPFFRRGLLKSIPTFVDKITKRFRRIR
jgi:HK97 gp10 family phage protein